MLSQCTCKNLLRGFSSTRFQFNSFHICSLFYLPSSHMLNSFCPILEYLTTHLSYHLFLFMEFLVPKLIAKTKSNQSHGQEVTLEKVLVHSYPMSRYRWEDPCLTLRTSTFQPCHIICQLGSGGIHGWGTTFGCLTV